MEDLIMVRDGALILGGIFVAGIVLIMLLETESFRTFCAICGSILSTAFVVLLIVTGLYGIGSFFHMVFS